MSEPCNECECCKRLLTRIDKNERYYMPIANDAKNLVIKYDKDKNKIEDELDDIRTSQTKEDMTLIEVLKRMNKHDENELIKAREREEERRARKSNFIAIMAIMSVILLSIIGSLLGFLLWLNSVTHTTDLRLQKIEDALGIEFHSDGL